MGNSVQDSIGYIFYAKDDSIYRHSDINGKEFIEIFNPVLGEFVFTYEDSIHITNNKYFWFDTVGIAHSEYKNPSGYIEKAIEILKRDEADVVGGPAKHVGKTWKGEAIARCMMHPFGVGQSSFRTERVKKYVDTVPFPIYKRSVLEDVGQYDEDFVRNQDDELNYRSRSKGYRILMDPSLETVYYVRENLKDLWNQYYQYGLYKPLVFKKVPHGKRWYHFVPAIFIVLMPASLGLGLLHWGFLLPAAAYLILLTIISVFIQNSLRRNEEG